MTMSKDQFIQGLASLPVAIIGPQPDRLITSATGPGRTTIETHRVILDGGTQPFGNKCPRENGWPGIAAMTVTFAEAFSPQGRGKFLWIFGAN